MNQDIYATKALTKTKMRRAAKRAERPTISKELFEEQFQNLELQAKEGHYQAQLKLEVIGKVLDPLLNFCESDVRRILNKGYSPQVTKGLQLYRTMRALRLFCEPVGKIVGIACRVKLINLEKISFDDLFNTKGAHGLVSRNSTKQQGRDNFNGLELLEAEEKDLYVRAKKYFGSRKRPTLKSLAISLLGEEDESFSDRSAINYLAAVKEFRIKHKDDLGYRWFFIGSLDLYNHNAKTVRESTIEGFSNLFKQDLKGLLPLTVDFSHLGRAMAQSAGAMNSAFQLSPAILHGIADFAKEATIAARTIGMFVQREVTGLLPFATRP